MQKNYNNLPMVEIPINEGKIVTNAWLRLRTEILKEYANYHETLVEEAIVEKGAEVDISGNYVYLKPLHILQKHYYVVDELGTLADRTASNVYNEDTGELVEGIDINNDEEFVLRFPDAIFRFCSNVLKSNKWAYETFLNATFKNYVTMSIANRQVIVGNIYNLFVHKSDVLEKLLKTNPDVFVKNLIKRIEFDGNLKDIFNIPQAAINYLSENGYAASISLLSEYADNLDGNEIMTFIDFVKSTKKLQGKTKEQRGRAIEKFVNFLNGSLKHSYPLTQTLSYIVRQTYISKEFNFENICDIAKTLSDYANMREENGFGERFPQYLMKAHNIMVINLSSLTKNNVKLQEDFEKATASYSHLSVTVNVNGTTDYIISVPKTARELVMEGNALNHCVGSYAKLVASGTSRIFFLRLASDPEKSLVTFEVNEKNEVVHAKGAFNLDPQPMEQRALKNWENWAKGK